MENMKRKAVSGIMLTLLLTSMLTLTFNVQPVKAGIIIVPDDYSTIQQAINAASPGDTIYVKADTYYENVVLNKTVSLVGENRENTVIDGGGIEPVVSVGAHNVVVVNFTIRNGGYGIKLGGSSNTIRNNIVVKHDHAGISVYGSNNTLTGNTITNIAEIGISISSSNNSVSENIIADNFAGIGLWGASYNSISRNNITNNSYGIVLGQSWYNTLSNNNISANGLGIHLDSSYFNNLVDNILTYNGNGILLDGSNNNVLRDNSIAYAASYCIAIGGSDNTLSGNTLSYSAEVGISIGGYLGYPALTRNNTLTNNTVTNNWAGIFIYQSSNNTLTGNTAKNNIVGIYLDTSNHSVIYHNNFINNTGQAFLENSTGNIWDDGYPSGGNYWSDYTGVDADKDGIGDTPYIIDEDNQDRYPLMNPWTPTPSTPDFSITASPTSLTIQQGNSDTSVITITSIGGFNQPVQLVVSAAPSGVIATLNPEQVAPPPDGIITSNLTVSVDTAAMPGSYTLTVTGTSDSLTHSVDISLEITALPPPEDQPPTCVIKLQKDGVEINEIDVGEFFDIYVGDSTDDTGIVQVRFSSDDFQDGNPTGEWTNWYDWDISSEDWDASTRIKRWAFATGGDKEVWAEVKDEAGQTVRCSANIYAITPREKMLIKIITEEAIGGLPVTVDGQQFIILTLKSYIDPVTLEVTPDVLTKVYVEATKNYPVSDPEIARKIGIIDYARQISEKIEEMQWNKQALMNIKNVYTTLRLGDLTTAAINIYVSGVEVIRDTKTVADVLANIQTIKDFAQLKVPASWSGLLTKLAELAMRVLIYDPMKELENDLLSELSQAIESYASALGTLEGEITEHSTARSFLWSYLSAEAHKDQAIYLFKKFLDNYKLFIVKLISGLATGALSNFVFLVKEAMDSLDWTITLIYNQIIASYENFAMVNYKLLESAEYTLELAGTPYELIHEYAIKYAEHVNEGYELAAEAVEMIITPMIPFFMRISIFSPVELRVYDSDGRVTGLVNGEEINEITNSIYHENTVIILASNDSYLYEIVGVEEGSYGLEIERVSLEENETITFTSTDIPISVNATHQYTINWDSLSQGEEGVTIKVDSNGDGIFELTFTSDSELTQDEFKLQVPPVEAFPMWIVGVAVVAVAIATAAIAVLWRRRKQPSTKG
jgi:parallel beta-helix repeat protein